MNLEKNIESNVVEMILNYGNIEYILGYVFARLRDRPYQLIRIYNIIGENWLKTTNEDEKVKLQYYLTEIFNYKLWFLSIKASFPEEIAFAYEYDFYVKNPINYINTDPTSIKTVIARACNLLGIKYTINNTGKKDNIRYIDDKLKNKGAINFYLYQSHDIEKNNSWKYMSTTIKMEDYFSIIKDDNIDNVFSCKNYQWFGFHIKMRRIFYILIKTLLELLTKNYHDNMLLLEAIEERDNTIIKKYDQLFKNNMSRGCIYFIESVSIYAKSNHYDSSIYNNLRKYQYFDFFSVIFNAYEEGFESFEPGDSLNMDIMDKYLNDVKYKLQYPELITSIINKVENDVNFDDNKLIKVKFQDDINADQLDIDVKEFQWLYSKRNTETNKIEKLDKNTINNINKGLSYYWFHLLKYKLSKYKEIENKTRYGNK